MLLVPSPLLTLVVPVLNSREQLSLLLQSIIQQGFADLEVVFSDGGSSDGSVDYALTTLSGERLEAVAIIRPGSSIYEAINLGVAVARGVWIQVMGCDDSYYASDVLQRVSSVLRESSADVVYGDAWFERDQGFVYGGPFWANRLAALNICHQSIFYRHACLKRLNICYNNRYPVYGDWDYNLHLFSKASFQYVPLLISRFSCAGKSSTIGDPLFEQERYQCFYRYLGITAFWRLSPDWLSRCLGPSPGWLERIGLLLNKSVYKVLRLISRGRIGRDGQRLRQMVYSGRQPPVNLASE